MAAPSLAPALDSASRRLVPRFPINIPLDVVALRSGVPNNIPGRCMDLSESGIGAIVAGELVAGQPVAVELRLPNVGLPVRARAQVKYHDHLHCGLQFVGLSVEQREMIRYWASQIISQSPGIAENTFDPVGLPALNVVPDRKQPTGRTRARRRRFFLAVVFLLAAIAFGWWQWQKAWGELESDASLTDFHSSPLRVPSETMDKAIVYKVDPVYPETARQAGTQGVVIFDALIAPDGSVKRLRSIAGPDELVQSAQHAVQSWKFTPYRSNGEPVEVETTITLDFRLR